MGHSAHLRAQQLRRKTLIRAPKYGRSGFYHGREKHRSAINLLKKVARMLWVTYSSRMDFVDSEVGVL